MKAALDAKAVVAEKDSVQTNYELCSRSLAAKGRCMFHTRWHHGTDEASPKGHADNVQMPLGARAEPNVCTWTRGYNIANSFRGAVQSDHVRGCTRTCKHGAKQRSRSP
jgi:hypothetical protein